MPPKTNLTIQSSIYTVFALKPDEYEKIVDRKIDFLNSEALLRAWADPYLYTSVIGEPRLALENGVTLFSEWYVSKMDIARVESFVHASDSAAFALRFCKKGETFGNRLLRLTHSLKNREFSRLSDVALLAQLDAFDQTALPLLAFLWPTHPVARVIERQLREAVEKRLSDPAGIEATLAELSFPARENTPVVENRELMKLAFALSRVKPIPSSYGACPAKIRASFSRHALFYGFLGVRSSGSIPWTVDDLFKRALEWVHVTDLAKKIGKSTGEVKANRLECDALMEHFRFSKHERALVGAAKELVYFRTYRTEMMYRAYHEVEPLLREIGRRFGVPVTRLRQMSVAELSCLVQLASPGLDLGHIASRSTRFCLVVSNRKIREFQGPESARFIRLFSIHPDDVSQLKGTPACPGIARGAARILLSPSHLDKINVGDVLFASMTTPDFLPAMRRAAAFVTDEGGITCHAAIVARELGKPCVIATKKGTKVFQDGDSVEVDGTLGIVRKLT